MNTDNPQPAPSAAAAGQLRLKIIGVGTAGCLLVDSLRPEDFPGTDFAFVNADNSAPTRASHQVLLEAKTLRGLGTGGDPGRGAALAEEHPEQLTALAAATDVVFLVTGLGGGAGGGITPVLARAARAAGALVLAFVTLPFECEGNRRRQLATQALAHLQNSCDGVLCLPNQRAFHLLPPEVGFVQAFQTTGRLLGESLRGVWRLLACRGLLAIHFEELRAVLRERHGESAFATLEASGPDRVPTLLAALETHPLLENGKSLDGASSILVSICAGTSLGMAEVNQLMEAISTRSPQARVILGAAVDEQFGDTLAVTIVATPPGAFESGIKSGDDDSQVAAEFTAELIHPAEGRRPKARLVPPAPELTAEQREQIITKQAGKSGRGRRNAGPRMRQISLPLDIVNKGRFDKSEPTIYKGEDLDLPTYIRRGISLN